MVAKNPILVTGAHRSGSTWVGKMLAASPNLIYVHEPFNITIYQPGICDIRFRNWFTYITDENEDRFYKPLKRMLDLRYNLPAALRHRHPPPLRQEFEEWVKFTRYRLRGMQPLLKDPIAVLSAEWLARRLDVQVIILIRHPAAFVSSLKKKNWTHPFAHFLHQPLLMREHLAPFADEIVEYAERPPDVIDQACLLWRIIYHVVSKYKARHRDWIFLRHEDISRTPLRRFKNLFVELRLDFLPEIEALVKEHSDASNPSEPDQSDNELKRDSRANIWNWKQRLSSAEIAHVRHQVEDVSMKFYASEDW